MLNKLTNLLLALVLLPLLGSGFAKAQNVTAADLSTDEAVLAEMQKIVDAEREKLGLVDKGRSKLDARDVCIKRLKESAKIIVVGFFAHDLGCRLDGAFIGSRYLKKGDPNFSREALAELGWAKAASKVREQLALQWTKKGLLAFSTVLNSKDKDFGNGEFHPPQAVSNENGEVTIKLWIQLPSGRDPEKRFRRVELKFDGAGSHTGG